MIVQYVGSNSFISFWSLLKQEELQRLKYRIDSVQLSKEVFARAEMKVHTEICQTEYSVQRLVVQVSKGM